MKRRTRFIVIAMLLVLPVLAFAQGLVPCSGNVGDECQFCTLAQLISNVIDWLVVILSIITGIIFTVAGLRLVLSTGNVAEKEAAKRLITNTFIGFVIVLACWLMVDTIMKVLLSGGAGEIELGLAPGPWNAIQCVTQPRAIDGITEFVRVQTIETCTTVDDCAARASACNSGRANGVGLVTGTGGSLAVTCTYTGSAAEAGGGGRVTAGGRGEAQCADDNPNCNVALLQSLGLTETQANVMSCVAVTENGGNAVGCSGTGPCGAFQITRRNWRMYTEGPGAAHSDCSAANFGGNLIAAQNNGPCNARVMTSMVRVSGYQPWTGAPSGGAPWNPYARGCVNTHSNGGDPTSRAF